MKLLMTSLFVIFFFPSIALSSTLETLFEDNFFSLHVPGRCGQNILNFLKLAERENIDLTGAEIINVDQGWVEPKFVRNEGYTPKVPGPEGIIHKPGKKYFYFHIFLIHQNRVYDFDYGNTPSVPGLQGYFSKMWLRGNGLDKSLGLSIYKAEDYLRGEAKPKNPKSMTMLKFLSERTGY